MGSKNRIAKHILPIMLAEANERKITTWVEPFVGGANLIDKVPNTFTRIGGDLNPHTIQALVAIRDFANHLPTTVTEQEYKNLKAQPPSPISSWIRFVCSVGGKFENGFARDKTNRNYAQEAKRNALKQSPQIQNIQFVCAPYQAISPTNSIIYCDPPYQKTTGYKTGKFNHEEFFDWCREMQKKGNLVYVSEYQAPEDFICVWQGEIKTNFASQRTTHTHSQIEKLFKVERS